jgi:hypothetical protein
MCDCRIIVRDENGKEELVDPGDLQNNGFCGYHQTESPAIAKPCLNPNPCANCKILTPQRA